MTRRKMVVLGLAAGALVLGQAAIAQQYQQQEQQIQQRMQQQGQGQQGLAQEVRNFIQEAENQLTQAVQQGNASQIRQWTQQNIAENATFTTLMQVSHRSSTPSSLRAEYTDKQDMLRKQAMMFSMAPELLQLVQDYNLDVQIQNVEQIDNNAAVIRTRISELLTLGGMGQQQSGQQKQGRGQLGAALSGAGAHTSISGIADCKQLIYRSQDTGRLVIGMSNCRAETTSY